MIPVAEEKMLMHNKPVVASTFILSIIPAPSVASEILRLLLVTMLRLYDFTS